MDGTSNGAGHGACITTGTHDHRGDVSGALRMQGIDGGDGFRHQSRMPYLADDADDLGQRGIRAVDEDALSNCVATGEVLPGERAVDDHDPWTRRAVGLREVTAGEYGDAHGREVPTTHEPAGGWAAVGGASRASLRAVPEARAARHAAQRWKLDRAGRNDTGYRGNPPEDRIERGDAGLRRPHAQEHPHRERPRRLEAKFETRQVHQRAKQEACPDQQHHGDGDLCDHEHEPCPPGVTIGARATATCAQHGVRLRMACLDRRHEPEGHRDDDRRAQRVDDGPGVQCHRTKGVDRKRERCQRGKRARQPPRERDAGQATGQREQETLGDDLADEASAPGAQRDP